ncbi:signal peptidase I [Pseudomonadota bacterium]
MFAELRKKLESVDHSGDISPRQPATALLLSICPGLGQQYAGNLARGISAYILLILVSWLAATLFMFIGGLFSLIFLAVPFIGVAVIGIDAYRCAARQPKDFRKRWFNRTWLYPVVFLLLLVTVNPLMDFLVGSNIIRAYFVTTESMAPAVLKHDLLLINKLASPQKGDLVLVDFRKDTKSKKLTKIIKDQLIRRIIAGPGDSVEIRGRQVFVNGEPLNEPYATYGRGSSHDPFNTETYHLEQKKVPSGSFFILADARNFGLDSRILGTIHKNQVDGVVSKIFWSWNLDAGSFKWERTALSLNQI